MVTPHSLGIFIKIVPEDYSDKLLFKEFQNGIKVFSMLSYVPTTHHCKSTARQSFLKLHMVY